MSQLEQEPISVKNAAAFLGVISVVVGVFLIIGVFLNWQRQQRVIKEYTQEAGVFIEQNKTQLADFFTQTFDRCRTLFPEAANNPSASTCQAAVEGLNTLNTSSLKDFSATGFMRYQNERVEFIETSGYYHRPRSLGNNWSYPINRIDVLRSYLLENQSINHWQDFVTYLPAKEVLIPVVIDNQTVGYLFRSVLEK